MAKFDLKTHLTCRFVTAITIAILLMGAVAVTFLVGNLDTLTSEMRVELVTNEKANLRVRTHNFASLSREQFEQLITDMQLASNYSTKLFAGELPTINYYPVFEGVITGSTTLPPGGIGDDNFGAWYSLTGSTTYQTNASVMADVFRPTLKSNPAYQAVYVGFEDASWLHHPFIDLSNLPTLLYTCVTTGNTVTGYDPRCREWYNNAKENQGSVQFSIPYIDATTGSVIITVSRSLVDAGGNFIGAIGFDLSMSESGFEENINEGTIIDNGYTYIYDSSGNIIFSPQLPDRDAVYSVLDVEFTKSSEKDAFGDTLDSMKAGDKGERDFTKDGDEWLINYEPVNGTIYGVAMVVPYSDINEPADDLDETVNSLQITMIIVSVVFTVVATVLATLYTRYYARTIVTPIKEFTAFTDRITQGKLDLEMGRVDCESKDLQIIKTKFDIILDALRFANQQFFNNNMGLALDNYKKMEKIFTDINNKRGLGVVWNNMAEATSCLETISNHIKEAERLFNKAIENAREHIAKAQKDKIEASGNTEKLADIKNTELFFKSVLGKRYSNLSLFYLEQKMYKEALSFSDKALEMHEEAEDVMGKMVTQGNRGLIFMEMDQADEAEAMFKSSHQTLLASYKSNPTKKKVEALQYASMNLGIHLRKCNKFDEACKYLIQALRITKTIHINLRNQCLLGLIEIYETPEYYAKHPDAQKKAEQIKAKYNLTHSAQQHIHFVLDVSGSMETDDRIGKSRNSIMDVITNYLNDNDLISLTVFSSYERKVFERWTKGEKMNEIRNQVMNNTRLTGCTRFYDAVGNAVNDLLESNMSNDNQWIIALTDGTDNESTTYKVDGKASNKLIDMIQKNDIGLFVLTIGRLSNSADIDRLTLDKRPNESKRRRHESIMDPSKIKDAFQNVASVIASLGKRNIESL